MTRGRPRLDLVGQRFGWLVVEGPAPDEQRGTERRVAWRCRCDCGAETVALTCYLRSRQTRSCGCGRGRRRSR